MKATLTSESYRTGPMIIKFFKLSQPVLLPACTEPVSELQLNYNYDTKTCSIHSVNSDADENFSESIYTLDPEKDDVFSEKTDKQLMLQFLNLSTHKKFEIETDCSVFEEY